MMNEPTRIVLGPLAFAAAGPYRSQREALAHLRELAAERDEEGLPTAVASALQEAALERFFAEVDLAELMLATGSTR
jgi:beta-phosphoglucomutase-like phosphatase (HAD superfamily)